MKRSFPSVTLFIVPCPCAGTGTARPNAATSPRSDDHAGPPQGEPFGPLLTFGRYEGWTLGQVSRVDRTFLLWLRDVPAGRGLKADIDAVLATRRGPGAVDEGHGHRSPAQHGAVDEARHYQTNKAKVHAWLPGAPTKVR